MNKKNVRSFAIGIIFTVSIIWLWGSFFQGEGEVEINIDEARNKLEESGFVILPEEEYEKLAALQKEEKKEEEITEEKEETSTEKTDDPNDHKKTLTIEKGMSSRDIARKLHEMNIIEDEHSFEQYLISQGYSKTLQIGSFELHDGMSYEEIANIIAK